MSVLDKNALLVSVDLWSVGCVFAEILTGRSLLKRKNRGEKGTKAIYKYYSFQIELNNLTKRINALVHQMKNSGKRTSFVLKLRCSDHNINMSVV
ncbi:hypothetical protein YC2023_065351 [Brassica napus]